jgi:hypothetical protein
MALRNMLLPLPPFAGQHGIVVMVDKLMPLFNRLDASRIAANATTRGSVQNGLLAAELALVEKRKLEVTA